MGDGVGVGVGVGGDDGMTAGFVAVVGLTVGAVDCGATFVVVPGDWLVAFAPAI